MRTLIVEDEVMAGNMLARTLTENFRDIEVVGITESVRATVDWLNAHAADPPDIIFMDVELSDGDCFEIFRQVEVRSQIIMTTAYDTYAVKAFETGSIDYLLKPIGLDALTRAVNRCRERQNAAGEVEQILKALGGRIPSKPRYKNRWVVRLGDKIIPVDIEDVAYFLSEDKSNSMMLSDGSRYIVDFTMDTLEHQLDPEKFFRISRGCIVARHAVKSVIRHFNGRLKLSAEPACDTELLVSRARVDDFLAWLE